MKLTLDQYEILKTINDNCDSTELNNLVKELESNIGTIKVECPQHEKINRP